jgi:hypothetical protein
MNHALDFDHLRFVQCDLDGANKRIMLEDALGSGHPTVIQTGAHLLTDCYLGER